MLANKVVNMRDYDLYEQLENFLDRKSLSSEHTAKNYRGDIRDFFKYALDIEELEYASISDLENLTIKDFDKFEYRMLQTQKVNSRTINRKTSAIGSFLKYLYSRDKIENISVLDKYEKLPEGAGNSYGSLRVTEVFEMAQLILETEKRDKISKYYLVLLAFDTCLRLSALLNLKWNDFEEKEETVLIKAVDKGNVNYRPHIKKDFYQELLKIKEDGKDNVFNISSSSVTRMIKNIRVIMDIPKERNIVFHSIRKAGGTFQYRMTKDLLLTMKTLNHKSPDTTKIYISDEETPILGAVSLSGQVDENLYKKVNHDDLTAFISEMTKEERFMFNMKLNKFIVKK